MDESSTELISSKAPQPARMQPGKLAAEAMGAREFTSLTGSSASPFGRISRQAPADLIARRTERMLIGKYGTPEEYFKYSLSVLDKKAKDGDIYAILQLAERYYSEAQDAQFEDGYDFDTPPQSLGRQYFEAAALRGHGEVLGKVIEIHLSEKRPAEALAWLTVAKNLGQHVSVAADSQLLSPDEKLRAAVRSKELMQQMLSMAQPPR